ncbi:hypothetical protein MOV08_35505 [Streptomyces yunnanensis]|uniref:Uncharacterized protein n=1 Tax=Streptomyces yunnanensis TaxID=156453 RepID=A0ABY8AKJ8_9ACTN|nr:hypothetical protein [Streptomyces yunnanensis]WEB44072.1 hypothetical protein MOV08_35505 [Streptomyces yunnanensis]
MPELMPVDDSGVAVGVDEANPFQPGVEFAVMIPDEHLTAATFATPATLWATLSALVQAASS